MPAYTGDWDIDLDQIRVDEDSRYKLLVAVLYISLQLQFDELTFEPTSEDYHVRARVGGEWCELAEVAVSHRGIVATSRWIWGFDPNGEGYEEGDLILSINGQSAIVEAIFEPNDVGQTLTFRFQHRSDPSAQRIPSDSGVLVG